MVIKSNSDHDERGLLPYPVIVAVNISCYEGHRYAFEIHQYT